MQQSCVAEAPHMGRRTARSCAALQPLTKSWSVPRPAQSKPQTGWRESSSSLPLGLQLCNILLQGIDLRLLGIHLALVAALLVLQHLVGDTGAHGRHRQGQHGGPEEAHRRPEEHRRPEHRRGDHGADANGDVGAGRKARSGLRLLLRALRGRRAAHAAAHAAHAAPAARRLRPADGQQGNEERGARRQDDAPSLARRARCRRGLRNVSCLSRKRLTLRMPGR
mmetsp:Transcript_5585/g.17851  ORF Transcript_5585/g.17851 Transcript_5585/m.17851 type:complete len:223 (+) Transcript_5585:129-797(+)